MLFSNICYSKYICTIRNYSILEKKKKMSHKKTGITTF